MSTTRTNDTYTELYDAYASTVQWSPNNEMLAFLSTDSCHRKSNNLRIWHLRTRTWYNTSAVTAVCLEDIDSFAWSPDSTRIVLQCRPSMWILNLTSSTMTKFVDSDSFSKEYEGRQRSLFYREITWSPNGRFIAAAGSHGVGDRVFLWTFEEDSEKNTNPIPVFKTAIQVRSVIYDVKWSPDSGYLAVAGFYDKLLLVLDKESDQFYPAPDVNHNSDRYVTKQSPDGLLCVRYPDLTNRTAYERPIHISVYSERIENIMDDYEVTQLYFYGGYWPPASVPLLRVTFAANAAEEILRDVAWLPDSRHIVALTSSRIAIWACASAGASSPVPVFEMPYEENNDFENFNNQRWMALSPTAVHARAAGAAAGEGYLLSVMHSCTRRAWLDIFYVPKDLENNNNNSKSKGNGKLLQSMTLQSSSEIDSVHTMWSPNGKQLMHNLCNEQKVVVETLCRWSDRDNYLFPGRFRTMVFAFMCARALLTQDVLPVELVLHVFSFL